MNEANEKGFVATDKSFEEADSTALAVKPQADTGLQTYSSYTDDGDMFIVNLTQRQINYCSMKPSTEEEKIVLFNAMNNPEKRLADCINEVIEVKDVFVEVVVPTPKEGQLPKACPRIVFIDSKGTSYVAVSLGAYGAVSKMFASFGTPDTWGKPRKFKVRQISKGNDKKILTLDAVIK